MIDHQHELDEIRRKLALATRSVEALELGMRSEVPSRTVLERSADAASQAPQDSETRAVGAAPAAAMLDVTDTHAAAHERERLITSLEFERRRLGTLLEKAPAFIAVMRGKDHVLELVNEAFYELVGRRDLTGRPVIEALPELRGQGLVELVDRVFETGEPLVRKALPVMLRRSGDHPEQRYVNVMYQPLVEADRTRTGVFAHGVDVTDEVTAQLRIRQAQKMEAVGRLAGGIAHDFNNILSVILSYTGMCLEDLPPASPIRADLEEVHKAGERAVGLTRQLLAFSRKQLLQPRIIDLNDIVQDLEPMLRRLLGADVELSVTQGRALREVCADPGQLEQVIMNLVVNARDAMPTGGKLSIETANVDLDEAFASEHLDTRPGPYVMLAVADTGTGMDEATRAQIFEPFFTTKGEGKGTGLGLSTVFGVVHQSGGDILVYSEPGHGSTFKIYLPRAAGTARTAALPVLVGPPVGGHETILLVEDDEAVRTLTRTLLGRGGYHVLDAHDAGEALLACEQFPGTIDLLVTDVVMPRMSGRGLAERLRPQRKDLKVLYMSGYTDDAIIQHGVVASGIAFLQKPITAEALLRKVREVLDDGEAAPPR